MRCNPELPQTIQSIVGEDAETDNRKAVSNVQVYTSATYSKFAQLANLSKEGDILLARLLSTDRIVSAQKPHGSAVKGSKTTIV